MKYGSSRSEQSVGRAGLIIMMVSVIKIEAVGNPLYYFHFEKQSSRRGSLASSSIKDH